MKLGHFFSDQINSGLPGGTRFSKVKVDQAYSWQEGLNNLPPLTKEEIHSNTWRFVGLGFLFFLTTLFLLGKTYELQVIHGKENLFLSDVNRILIERKLPERGLIYDRDGIILAKNIPGFRATLNYGQVGEEKKNELIEKLSSTLGMARQDIEQKFSEASISPYTFITLKSGISHEQQLALEALQDELPGVNVTKDVLRSYPEGKAFAHVLGYLGAISKEELKDANFADYLSGDFLGREGLEKTYETLLRGDVGRRLIETDAMGKLKSVIAEEETTPGNNLFLSLEANFQEKAAELLSVAIKKYAATAGVFIVEEVKSGQILSFVIIPSFDNNLFSGSSTSETLDNLLNDPQKPLFNRAIAGTYPPGSTVKPFVAAAALQEKIITSSTRIDDYPQVIKIGPPAGGWEFPDWTATWGRAAHGVLTVREAIAESCDTFFYKIGGGYEGECKMQNIKCKIEGLGIEKLKTYFNLFGLGQKTGIDLPGEAKGLVPDPIWKEEVKKEDWFLGNTYHLSIGQGDLLTTPLQILQGINAIANDGKLVKPHLVERIETADGKLVSKYKPEIIREGFINKDYIGVVAEGMRMAVSDGIVYPLRTAKVPVAAKTGTAEFGTKNAKGEYQTHAWVTGFAPYDNPEISFVLLLESGGASSNAAEVAREILDWYFGR